MSDPAGPGTRLQAALTTAAAIVFGGVLAAIVWLSVIAEGFHGGILDRTWTEHDFAGGLGNAWGSTETSRVGLFISLFLGVAIAALVLAVLHRVPGRGWRKGLLIAPGLFLLWAALYCPLIDARRVLRDDGKFIFLPNGPLGIDAGWGTIPSAAAASLATGVLLAHVLPIMRRRSWWERRVSGTGEEADGGLLELAEEGPEQRVEGSR